MQRTKLELVKDDEEESTSGCWMLEETPVSGYRTILHRLLHLFDYVAILRPLLLIPVWTMLLVAYYKGSYAKFTTRVSLPLTGNIPIVLHPDNEILITILLYSLLMGAVYILNQISDSHADEINGKLYLVARGYMKKSSMKIQIGILFFVSVLIALLGVWGIFPILRFPQTYIYMILLSIIFGVLYSVPPVRLKGRPILDLLANASGFGILAFAVGWTSRSAPSMEMILDCLPYFICVSAAFINTTIPDIKGDIQNGDKTTGVLLGIRNSCMLSTLLLSTVPLISFLLRDFICLIASLVSFPFFVYMTITNWDERSPKISTVTLATRVSLLLLSFLVAAVVPFYFVLLIFTPLLMRAYYQLRFGISYP